MPKLARRLLAPTLGLVLAVASAECLLRVTLDGGWSRTAALEELDRRRAEILGTRAEARVADREPTADAGLPWTLSPWVGFDLERTPDEVAEDLAAQTAEPSAFRVLLVGGSVAADFGWWGREVLLDALRVDPSLAGREPELLNYARPAFKQPQQLHLVAWLFAVGLEPDAVINLDGFNEVAVAAVNASAGLHHGLPAVGQWAPLLSEAVGSADELALAGEAWAARAAALSSIDRAQRSPRLHCALLGRGLLRAAREGHAAQIAANQRLVASRTGPDSLGATPWPAVPGDPGAVLDSCADLWEACGRMLAAICEARDVPYLHVLQPTLHDDGAKLASAEELAHPVSPVWRQATRAGYPRLRARATSMAAEGYPMLDASLVFAGVEETLYFDACHFVESGHRRLAAEVARALVEQR